MFFSSISESPLTFRCFLLRKRGDTAGEVLICYLHYHLIFAVKFRRKGTIKQKIHEISETFEVEIIAIALN